MSSAVLHLRVIRTFKNSPHINDMSKEIKMYFWNSSFQNWKDQVSTVSQAHFILMEAWDIRKWDGFAFLINPVILVRSSLNC